MLCEMTFACVMRILLFLLYDDTRGLLLWRCFALLLLTSVISLSALSVMCEIFMNTAYCA